jgi:hypothetical protein
MQRFDRCLFCVSEIVALILTRINILTYHNYTTDTKTLLVYACLMHSPQASTQEEGSVLDHSNNKFDR